MSAIKKLTGVGGDIRQIAALLQSKGRRGDSILAHITPREAALLRSQGGSGTTNPETGLQEFYEDFSFSDPAMDYGTAPMDTSSFDTAAAPQDQGFIPQDLGEYEQQATQAQQAFQPTAEQPAAPAARAVAKPSLSDLLKIPQAVRPFMPAAAATAAGAMGAQQARQAQKESQQYRTDLQRIAAPYQTQGQQMIGAAQRGELTPVNRQALEATRAQLAQQVQGRGGVGAMQATEQIARMQQTLLQNQYDYGLKLANLGDQIAIGAIKTGMQADKDMRALLQNYMTGAARLVGGSRSVLGTAQEEQ